MAAGAVVAPPLVTAAGVVPPAVELVRFPEKTDLVLLTDRPPQLETPLRYFLHDITPNKAFFVRWHLEGIPTSVNTATFRLEIGGHVEKPLSLSVANLRSSLNPFRSSRSTNAPATRAVSLLRACRAASWKNGAMGNARWTGVRLRDLLDRAGVKAGTMDVSFGGLDRAPLSAKPGFVKALDIKHARDGEVMVAYDMNGAPLPMLNGFPLRLVVPGWYATYWVKALQQITVLREKFHGFWMDEGTGFRPLRMPPKHPVIWPARPSPSIA